MSSNHPDDKTQVQKTFISSETLLDISFKLAIKIFNSPFSPDYIVGIWRGGTPVGIAVQELLSYLGTKTDHIAIRTSSYKGIAERDRNIRVHGLHYIIENIEDTDSLLIVDDVFDTGLSVEQVIKDIKKHCRKNTPTIRVATPYFKPKNNQTDIVPDFYIEETADWLVFPHELIGLSAEELRQNKGLLSQHLEQHNLLK